MPVHELPPTRVRYGVLGFSVGMAVLLYLDRFALSVLTPALCDELRCTREEFGSAVGAFFLSYALAQLPAAWLGDRWGGRITLTAYVAVWSAAMGGLAFAKTLGAIVALRLVLGLGQAGAYATTAAFLKRWFPLSQRGFANGSVAMGGRAGYLLANLLTPPLVGLFVYLLGGETLGWRATFILYAALGWIWCVAFYRWFRNTPAEHPRCNEAERQLIQADEVQQSTGVATATKKFPWRGLLRSRNVWLLCIINFCINVGWIFVAAWLPDHLVSVYALTSVHAGLFTAATGLAGMAGCLSGGWITDRVVRRFGLVWGRRLPALLACGGPALAYVGCVLTDNLVVLLLLLGSVWFLADLWNAAAWSTYQDIGGVHVGSVLAIGNMCGNLGAAVFSKAIGHFADTKEWSAVFAISAASFTVALACWLFVNPRVPVESR